MRWIPHIEIFNTAIMFDDGDVEGWSLGVHWLGLVFEITLARDTRHV